jgi:hypothetical protein
MPVLVQGGDEDLVFKRSETKRYPMGITVSGVWVFHGLDRGDIVEMDTEVVTGEGFQLVVRSDHKEVMGNYPGWTFYPADHVETDRLRIKLACRVNGTQANREHPRFGQLSARAHFGLIVNIWKNHG